MSDTDTITFNGREYTPDQVETAVSHITNESRTAPTSSPNLQTPGSLRSILGDQFGGDRDLYETLGYDEDPDFDDYHAKYKRGDIASRLVELPAKDTWRRQPDAVDDTDTEDATDFEDDVAGLLDARLNSICRRLDIAAGIGEYGLLLFGFADGAEDFATEVTPGSFTGDPAEDIAYFSIFTQGDVIDWRLGKDVGRNIDDDRYNLPVEYDIDFAETGSESDDEKTVHWTRLVHVPATEPVFSKLRASPRLENCYNRHDDLEKVVGAAAEAAWHGADRKFHFDVRDEYADGIDLSSLGDEVEKLVHDLQPYLKTAGVDLDVVGGEDVDPSGVVEAELKLIAGARGIPMRKLVGSERGEQASTQDRANWFDQVSSRQTNYAEEFILRPIIDRLVEFNILPSPKDSDYQIEWPNLFELTEVEESEVQLNRAKTAKNAMPQGNTDLAPGGMAGVIEYLDTGEFPDPEPDTGPPTDPMDDVDESDPEVREAFEAMRNGHSDS